LPPQALSRGAVEAAKLTGPTDPDSEQWLATVEPDLRRGLLDTARRLDQAFPTRSGASQLLRRVRMAGVRTGEDVLRLADAENDPDTRALGCELLSMVGGRQRALATLMRIADRDSDEDVQIAAIRSIASIGGQRARRWLRTTVQHATGMAQIMAINAIGLTGDADDHDVQLLLDVLVNDEQDEIARAEAAEALGHIGEPADRTVPQLVSALETATPPVTHASAFALGNIGDPRSLDALTRAATDSTDKTLRQYATEAIETIKEIQEGAP
jgi:HEAT repeat protein